MIDPNFYISVKVKKNWNSEQITMLHQQNNIFSIKFRCKRQDHLNCCYPCVANTSMNPLGVNKSLPMRKITFRAMLNKIMLNCVIVPDPFTLVSNFSFLGRGKFSP